MRFTCIPKAKDAKVKDFSLKAFQQDCYNLFVDQQWLEK
jgi:hypothetical protein